MQPANLVVQLTEITCAHWMACSTEHQTSMQVLRCAGPGAHVITSSEKVYNVTTTHQQKASLLVSLSFTHMAECLININKNYRAKTAQCTTHRLEISNWCINEQPTSFKKYESEGLHDCTLHCLPGRTLSHPSMTTVLLSGTLLTSMTRSNRRIKKSKHWDREWLLSRQLLSPYTTTWPLHQE